MEDRGISVNGGPDPELNPPVLGAAMGGPLRFATSRELCQSSANDYSEV
jgi:hypothetical protein